MSQISLSHEHEPKWWKKWGYKEVMHGIREHEVMLLASHLKDRVIVWTFDGKIESLYEYKRRYISQYGKLICFAKKYVKWHRLWIYCF